MLKRILFLLIVVGMSACTQKPTLEDLDGKAISLNDYRGKWVIIHYWADWCDICVKEIPELNAFYKANSNKVVVLGVNYDQLPTSELRSIINHMEIKFPVLSKDPALQLGIRDITGLPVTFVVDPEGKVHEPLLGMQTRHSLEAATIGNHAK